MPPEQPQIIGNDYTGRAAVSPERGMASEAGIGPSESNALPTQDVDAKAPPILPMGAGLEDVSKAVGEYGMQQQQAQQQTWLMSQGANYDAQARQIIGNAMRNAQPGQSIGPTVSDALSKLRTDSLTGIDNPELAGAYNDRMMRTQQEIMGHAAEYDFNERDRYTKFNVVQGFQTMAKTIGTSTNYDDAQNQGTQYLGELGHTLDQTPMLPQDKQALLMEGRGLIGDAVNRQQQNIDLNRWIAEHSTAFPSQMRDMINLPRGIRNNNPGNLEGGGEWQGMTGADKGGYLTFDTPENGLRAMAINLRNQQDKYGLNTVQDIITKYAPPFKTDPATGQQVPENDTAAYIQDVAHKLNVQPDQKLDLHDPEVLSKFSDAVIRHENNGAQPYSPDTMNWAVGNALGQNSSAPPSSNTADGGARTGNLPFNILTYPEQQKLVTSAYTEMRRIRSESAFYGNMANTDLTSIEKAAEEGVPVPDSLIQSAQAKVQAAPTPALQARMQAANDKIATSTAMYKMTPMEAQQYSLGLEKQATSPGATPEMLENYTFSQKVLANMTRQFHEDPVAYMSRNTAGPNLDFSMDGNGKLKSPDTFSNRISLADNAIAAGAQPKDSYLSKNEQQFFGGKLASADASGKIMWANALGQGFGDRTADALAPLNKSEPLFSTGADILAHNPSSGTVVSDMFRGEEMLKKNRDGAPANKDVEAALQNYSGYLPPAYLNQLAEPLRAVGMARGYGKDEASMGDILNSATDQLIGAEKSDKWGPNVAPVGVRANDFDNFLSSLSQKDFQKMAGSPYYATSKGKPTSEMDVSDFNNGIKMITIRPGLYQFVDRNGNTVAGNGPKGAAVLRLTPADIYGAK